jgi:hypothetical protein|tara:strand:+ start:1432 stop:3294 length:1863 start_codon:yes stop_codon:yes gene_type:complete
MNSDRLELIDKISTDIKDRTRWEHRQSIWYEMRHHGLRRKSKPWPNASDLHFPLADSIIERLKPFYFMQISGMDVLSSFVPMRQQDSGLTVMAEQWFDYHMKEHTNFLDEALSWVDHGLMSGRSVMKVYWDEKKKSVQFDSIDPLMLLVPNSTKKLQDADRIVQVMQYTKDSFKNSPFFNEEILIELVGRKSKAANSDEKEQKVYRREGITYHSDENKIIVWEVYERDGKDITISTFCPEVPDMDLRPQMGMPYNHKLFPFVDFSYEVKDKGWYSPRGVCEITAPHEASLCKLWNDKHDAMTLYNRPLFRAEREIPNAANIRMAPAQILPIGVAPVPQPQPPISFDTEINATRLIAEQRIGMPDFGSNQLYGQGGDRRTATEVNAITGLMAETNDLRAKIFRMSLGGLYRQAWGLFLQYKSKDLMFRYMDDAYEVNADAFTGDYVIEPKGGPDSQNRMRKLQQAMTRKQLFTGSPHINQAELDRSILELDDPSLVKRMFMDSGIKQMNEQLEEANNISIIEAGFPVPVKGGEDYPTRVGVLIQYVQQKMQDGTPIDERTSALIVQRLNELLSAYEQVDASAAKQLRKAIAQAASGLLQGGQEGANAAQGQGDTGQVPAGV